MTAGADGDLTLTVILRYRAQRPASKMPVEEPIEARFKVKAEKQVCHKLSPAKRGHPEGAELHKRGAEASGFDRTACHSRTGHKERAPWETT